MKTKLLLAVALAAAVALIGGRALAKYPQTITTSSPYVNLPRPSDDPRWGEAFGHWDQREKTDQVMAAIALFETLSRDKPGQLEPWLWLTRSYLLAGMRQKKDRIEYMDKARTAGDRALAIDPNHDAVKYWRFCSLGFIRDLKPEEIVEIKKFGEKQRGIRDLPVPDDDPLWAQAMARWDGRSKKEEAEAAVKIFEQLEKKDPTRAEPRLWLARACYFLYYLEPTREGKAKRGFDAANWAKKALELEPRNPAANFWVASGLGQYADNTSFVNIVRYALEMGKSLLVVTEEEPLYFYGGFSNWFASALARAGELVGKTAELLGFPPEMIERLTVFASNYEPNYLRNFFSLAEMYIASGRMDEARKNLETVINSDPTVLKLMTPENLLVQDLAKELMKKHFSGEPKK